MYIYLPICFQRPINLFMNTKSRFDGIARLYGDKGAQALKDAHILIVGLGGVGTWAAESLARSGVGEISLVDMDEICISNTNRQIHAHDGNYGKMKVEALKERIKLINPDCKINECIDFFTKDTKDEILGITYDYVIDCIDSVRNKCLLITECKRRAIPIVTTGGAGGKFDPTKVQIVDLNKSYNDKLLMVIRNNLKRFHGFPRDKKANYKIACVFSPEDRTIPEQSCNTGNLNCATGFGAITHITGIFGFMAAGHVINSIVDKLRE